MAFPIPVVTSFPPQSQRPTDPSAGANPPQSADDRVRRRRERKLSSVCYAFQATTKKKESIERFASRAVFITNENETKIERETMAVAEHEPAVSQFGQKNRSFNKKRELHTWPSID